jgi:hypothetical protein
MEFDPNQPGVMELVEELHKRQLARLDREKRLEESEFKEFEDNLVQIREDLNKNSAPRVEFLLDSYQTDDEIRKQERLNRDKE